MLELSGKMGKSVAFKVPGLPVLTVTMHFAGRLLMRNGALDSVLCHPSWELRSGRAQVECRFPVVVPQWDYRTSRFLKTSGPHSQLCPLCLLVGWTEGILNAGHTCLALRCLCGTVLDPVFFSGPRVPDSLKMNKRTCVILVYFHKRGILIWEGFLLLLLGLECLMQLMYLMALLL